jgi:hypothetical protein
MDMVDPVVDGGAELCHSESMALGWVPDSAVRWVEA